VKAVVSEWMKYAEQALLSENRAMEIALSIEEIRGISIKGISSEQREYHLNRMQSKAKIKNETVAESLGTKIKSLCENKRQFLLHHCS